MSAIQFYGWNTPNGQKISILLEELGVDYKYIPIDLSKNVQKESWFLKINPNGRIPAIIDQEASDFAVFESGAILIYLAEKYKKFLPTDVKLRSQVIQWVFFQNAGVGPMMGQAFFFSGQSEKIPFAINRYVNESKRLLQVLETQLTDRKFLVDGDEPTIADFTTVTWARNYSRPQFGFTATEFPNLAKWVERLEARPGVKKGFGIFPAPAPTKILVTGSNGNIGKRIVNLLAEQKKPVVAAVRELSKADDFKAKGVEVRQLSYDDAKTYEKALEGIHTLYVSATGTKDTPTSDKALYEAAKKAGVKYIVRLGTDVADEKVPNDDWHSCQYENGQSDVYLRASGVDYAIVRPSLFASNFLFHVHDIKTKNSFSQAAEEKSKAPFIHSDDISEAVVNILTNPDKYKNKTYVLTGPENLSWPEAAKLLSDVVGREIKYEKMSLDDQVKRFLSWGFPEWRAKGLSQLDKLQTDGFFKVTTDLKELLGKEPRTLKSFFEENKNAFM